MIPHYKNIHNRFTFNGVHLDKEALFQMAYSAIKEGEDFEKEFCESLLKGVVQNWEKIGNTSTEGLRESFLRREGLIRKTNKDNMKSECLSCMKPGEFVFWFRIHTNRN